MARSIRNGDTVRCPLCGRVWLRWPCDSSVWTWCCWYDGTRLVVVEPDATPPGIEHVL